MDARSARSPIGCPAGTTSGYKTLSYETTLLLAKLPSVHLLATRQKKIYERLLDLKRRHEYSLEARGDLEGGNGNYATVMDYTAMDIASQNGGRLCVGLIKAL